MALLAAPDKKLIGDCRWNESQKRKEEEEEADGAFFFWEKEGGSGAGGSTMKRVYGGWMDAGEGRERERIKVGKKENNKT